MSQKPRDEILEYLEEVGAICRNGHFVLNSGKHTHTYVNKDDAYLDVHALSLICKNIADHFRGLQIDVVAAPAVGGVALIQHVSLHLTDGPLLAPRAPVAVFGRQKPDKEFEFRGRSKLQFADGKKVLVVDDIMTTGGSVKRLIAAIRALGGYIVGVGVICHRNPATVTAKTLGVPELFYLTSVAAPEWDESLCPLCAAGAPVNTEMGKGAEYLARKRKEHEEQAGATMLT